MATLKIGEVGGRISFSAYRLGAGRSEGRNITRTCNKVAVNVQDVAIVRNEVISLVNNSIS